MTSRFRKKLDSIQRLLLLYINGAYRTTPTAAPSGHRSSTHPPTNPTRSNLCPSCSSKIFIQLFRSYLQPKRLRKQKQWNSYSPPFAEKHRGSEAKTIYTDGSKTDEGTGSAYCILENYGIIASWQGKLDHSNSVFQAEILVIKIAI
ncbi:hypothetical protein AVEN_159328-1 [Araneus ventricosus]|uniref:RNase H type-1 domain-containing protein n=1 Tax=Araneus ventricosus TaxID=182803 RepID=A0A4Y2A1M6_ARAVE|nr:hypothetical protein AVEN_159328-1 [Araneus ventricosus]